MNVFKNHLPRLAVAVLGATVLGLLAAGSTATYTPLTKMAPVPIQYGTLVNKNIRIEGTNSFWPEPWKVKGGEDFQTPFSVYWWGNNAPQMNDANIMDKWQEAHRKGARPVEIHIDGYKEPIYGLIAFNQAIDATFGPARQSYYLQIPEDKLRQAINGNMSVAYEKISYKQEWQSDTGYQSRDQKWYSWVLWMSRTPLASESRTIN